MTTSGTAVGNLHPAVLEAAHSGVPLVVISGDRPEELREIGANQTTRQAGIFAGVAARSWDVPAPVAGDDVRADALAAEVLDGIDGPRHVNLAFREPLSGPVRLPDVEPGVWTVPLRDPEPLALDARPGPSSWPGPAQVRGPRRSLANSAHRCWPRSPAARGSARTWCPLTAS